MCFPILHPLHSGTCRPKHRSSARGRGGPRRGSPSRLPRRRLRQLPTHTATGRPRQGSHSYGSRAWESHLHITCFCSCNSGSAPFEVQWGRDATGCMRCLHPPSPRWDSHGAPPPGRRRGPASAAREEDSLRRTPAQPRHTARATPPRTPLRTTLHSALLPIQPCSSRSCHRGATHAPRRPSSLDPTHAHTLSLPPALRRPRSSHEAGPAHARPLPGTTVCSPGRPAADWLPQLACHDQNPERLAGVLHLHRRDSLHHRLH